MLTPLPGHPHNTSLTPFSHYHPHTFFTLPSLYLLHTTVLTPFHTTILITFSRYRPHTISHYYSHTFFTLPSHYCADANTRTLSSHHFTLPRSHHFHTTILTPFSHYRTHTVSTLPSSHFFHTTTLTPFSHYCADVTIKTLSSHHFHATILTPF